MKKYKIILLLFIASVFILTGFKEIKTTKNHAEDKWRSTISTEFRGTRSLPTYEVRLTYTGYGTFVGIEDCPIRTNGTVVLTGLLSGPENVASDDDMFYIGILQLDIDMDICSIKHLPSGEAKLCGMTVTGSGLVKVELEIQSDERGGYIQMRDTTSRGFTKHVTGSCDQEQLDGERDNVPLNTKACLFSGSPLPMLTQRTLRVGRYVGTGDFVGVVVEVLRKVKP